MQTSNAKKVVKLNKSNFIELLNCGLRNCEQDVAFLNSQITDSGDCLVDFKLESSWGRERIDFVVEPPWVLDVDVESIGCFPLKTRHASVYYKPRIVLLGFILY